MYKSSFMCYIEKSSQILKCRKSKVRYMIFEIKSNYKVDSILQIIYVIELNLITKDGTLKNSHHKLPLQPNLFPMAS
jgi:hypothetical protein